MRGRRKRIHPIANLTIADALLAKEIEATKNGVLDYQRSISRESLNRAVPSKRPWEYRSDIVESNSKLENTQFIGNSGGQEHVSDAICEASSGKESNGVCSPTKATKTVTSDNKYVASRNRMKNDYFDVAVDEMMFAVNEYQLNIDISHAAAAEKQTATKNHRTIAKILFYLKVFGWLEFTLHELVLYETSEVLLKRVRELSSGDRPQPALLNQYDVRGQTPLSLAVKIGRRDVACYLLDAGASPDICDEGTGRSVLFYSVSKQYIKISRDLILAGCDVNQCDSQQITPLMIACRNNDVKHVRLLKESKVYLDFQDTNGWCALHYAVYGNSEKSVRYLLESGADYSCRDNNGRLPVDLAKFKNYQEIHLMLFNRKEKRSDDFGTLEDSDDSSDDGL